MSIWKKLNGKAVLITAGKRQKNSKRVKKSWNGRRGERGDFGMLIDGTKLIMKRTKKKKKKKRGSNRSEAIGEAKNERACPFYKGKKHDSTDLFQTPIGDKQDPSIPIAKRGKL